MNDFILEPTEKELEVCRLQLFPELPKSSPENPDSTSHSRSSPRENSTSCESSNTPVITQKKGTQINSIHPESPSWTVPTPIVRDHWLTEAGESPIERSRVLDLIPWQGSMVYLLEGGRVMHQVPGRGLRLLTTERQAEQLIPLDQALYLSLPNTQLGGKSNKQLRVISGHYRGTLPSNFEEVNFLPGRPWIWFRGSSLRSSPLGDSTPKSYLLNLQTGRLSPEDSVEERLYFDEETYLRLNPLPILLVSPEVMQPLEDFTVATFDPEGQVIGVNDQSTREIRVIGDRRFLKLAGGTD